MPHHFPSSAMVHHGGISFTSKREGFLQTGLSLLSPFSKPHRQTSKPPNLQSHQGTAGISLWFHLPGFHFRFAFLTHGHIYIYIYMYRYSPSPSSGRFVPAPRPSKEAYTAETRSSACDWRFRFHRCPWKGGLLQSAHNPLAGLADQAASSKQNHGNKRLPRFKGVPFKSLGLVGLDRLGLGGVPFKGLGWFGNEKHGGRFLVKNHTREILPPLQRLQINWWCPLKRSPHLELPVQGTWQPETL